MFFYTSHSRHFYHLSVYCLQYNNQVGVSTCTGMPIVSPKMNNRLLHRPLCPAGTD